MTHVLPKVPKAAAPSVTTSDRRVQAEVIVARRYLDHGFVDAAMRQQPGLTERDILLAVTTLSFDIAGLELYLPLVCGAQVVLADREQAANGKELLRLMQESQATAMQATPATWRLIRSWAMTRAFTTKPIPFTPWS